MKKIFFPSAEKALPGERKMEEGRMDRRRECLKTEGKKERRKEGDGQLTEKFVTRSGSKIRRARVGLAEQALRKFGFWGSFDAEVEGRRLKVGTGLGGTSRACQR